MNKPTKIINPEQSFAQAKNYQNSSQLTTSTWQNWVDLLEDREDSSLCMQALLQLKRLGKHPERFCLLDWDSVKNDW